jgi:hypothetical protein
MLTKFAEDLNIIRNLPSKPTPNGGYTASGLQAKWDESGIKTQNYINNILTSEVDSHFSDIDTSINDMQTKINNMAANASVIYQIDTYAANMTISTSNEFVMLNASSGAKTVALPAADVNKGRLYIIKKTDSSSNVVTISGSVNGGTNYNLTAQNQSVRLISDGTTWQTV